jgi:sugar phosphate permease
MCACIIAYSVAVFAPTILATFGWDSIKANLLSAPLRVASGLSAICMGIASDRLKIRGPFCVGAFILGIIGNCCVGFLKEGGLRMGLYFMAIGVNGVQALIIAWW